MTTGRCARLALCLTILLLALEQTRAIGKNEGNGRKRWTMGSETRNDVSLLSTALDGTASADPNGRKNLWGRKMLQGLDEEASYVSGENKPPAPPANDIRNAQTEHDHFNFQNKKMGNHKSSERVRAPRSGDHEVAFAKHDDSSGQKVENPKAFLEAADEVANLMRKDYKGPDRPRRKPPINNHEPTH